ncbi:MAG: PEP-CTERM sorting domain-containing protein [Akkermansia sp.]|nr:PEP-CTERM sorting domain-containing protein [Akkermansia sp.]
MKKTLIALMALAGYATGTSLNEATIVTAGNQGITTSKGSFTIALTLDVDLLRVILEKNKTPSWGTDIIRYEIIGYEDIKDPDTQEVIGRRQTNTATGVTINGVSSSNKINSSGLYARWGDTTAWNSVRWDGGNNLSDLNGDTEGTGWDSVAYAGLVYSFGATNGTTVAFTLLDFSGDVIVQSCVTASGLKSGSAGINTSITDDPAESITFHKSVETSYYFDGYKGGTDAKVSDLKALSTAVAKAAPIPEPTTATLSLLALAGLATRRRRR